MRISLTNEITHDVKPHLRLPFEKGPKDTAAKMSLKVNSAMRTGQVV